MPAPHPLEFRRGAIDLARQPGASAAEVAKELGISESGLRRDKRRLERENEILQRASAYFARENGAPRVWFRWLESSPCISSTSRWPAES